MTTSAHFPAQHTYQCWQQSHWEALNKAHLVHDDISPVMDKLATHSNITRARIGHSYFGRPIDRLSLGTGPLTILAWTQMHGDEPTATAAVLDWLYLLTESALPALPHDWLNSVTVHIIPMLNPDGAAVRTRVNGQGIDINRDAQVLQSPEGRLLEAQVRELNPDVAFNLHDQNDYYTAGRTPHPATIAFLAPAFHQDKHVDGARLRAKQLIAEMAHQLRPWLPKQIGRYDDTYSYRSFGDNIAASGASTILIESGAALGDPHRQTARVMNVVALQAALESLLSGTYRQRSLADYYAIPDNHEDGLVQLKISQVTLGVTSTEFVADIAINIDRKTGIASVDQMGDLSVVAGFEEIAGAAYIVMPSKGYALSHADVLDDAHYFALLRQGYNYVLNPDNAELTTSLPVKVDTQFYDGLLPLPNGDAFFLLAEKNAAPESAALAILNGRVIDLRGE